MKMIKYSISIVCHNNLELTIKCINSILKYSKDFELIIWNNGSTDGTKEYLNKLHNKCKVNINHNKTNIGFTIPQNRNTKKANGKYFVVLNNDVEVCENWLEKLSEPFNDDNIGIVGIKDACSCLRDDASGYPSTDTEYIEGSCLMTLNSIIKKHGLFDEDTFEFAYCEDADFSLKLRELGYKIKRVDLNIKHIRASTSNIVKEDIKGYEIKNKIMLLKKWSLYFKNRNFKYKILVEREGALGDVIMTTPIVHALKKRYPLSEIYVKTRCKEVYERNPDVKEIISNKATSNGYDIHYNLDLAYEIYTQMSVVDAYSFLSIEVKDKSYKLYTNKEEDELIKKDYSNKKIAIFHVQHTSNWWGKNFNIDKYKAGVEYLRKLGFTIVEVGRRRYLNSDINYNNTSFSKVCSIIKNAKIFIGQDSGLFHIAQAFKVPNIIPFGMLYPERLVVDFNITYPLTDKLLGCLGCHQWQPGVRTTVVKCPREKVYCMENIKKEDLINMIDKVIKEKQL